MNRGPLVVGWLLVVCLLAAGCRSPYYGDRGAVLGGLTGAGWGVSASMLAYFAYYFWALANWKDIPHESRA